MSEQAAQRAYDRTSVETYISYPYHTCRDCPRWQRAWQTALEKVRVSRHPAATTSADQEAEQ